VVFVIKLKVVLNFILNKLEYLKIKSEIINQVKIFIENNNINKDTYGILFRKTDYSSNPSISLNDNGIYNHIRSDLNLKYYICSDDKDTEDKFNELDCEDESFVFGELVPDEADGVNVILVGSID
jgi:hypothetical protein